MTRKTIENMTAAQVADCLRGWTLPRMPLAAIKIPADPEFHQKPGRVMVPIALKTALQILEEVHHSARYTVEIEVINHEAVIRLYGKGQK